MTDTYQAIYDAVRSRISNGNIGDAVRDVLRDAFDISHARAVIQQEIVCAAQEMQRPSVLYRPSLRADGAKWCALYGDDLAQGIAGFGDTPAEAMIDFDQNWRKARTS
ncbi:MAG: hypothetical protein KGL35_12130 [Bradyrhizobium sp.]|nr:hypothetical protein [Bradyrhizobium sp.]